uniref:Uncharacterized protein n=1 Tax=Siphoviridae sp. ctrfD19 TaxID=2826478 RepID=A0A8S5M1Y2_9CAUD|nr:MAG TPA: hypothetical protein [Siphoviridae sp. ctrfD19]
MGLNEKGRKSRICRCKITMKPKAQRSRWLNPLSVVKSF